VNFGDIVFFETIFTIFNFYSMHSHQPWGILTQEFSTLELNTKLWRQKQKYMTFYRTAMYFSPKSMLSHTLKTNSLIRKNKLFSWLIAPCREKDYVRGNNLW
jgi:hypothetical protein